MNAKLLKTSKLSALVLLIVYSVNCTLNDPEEIFVPDIAPNEQVLDTFNEKYPDAEDIIWYIKADYYVACFTQTSIPACAWFDNGGEWFLSAENYSFDRLHHKISETFFSSIYSDWYVEKVDRLERKDMDAVYVISVTEANRFANLYYSRFGTFIRAMAEGKNYVHYPVVIPPPISRKLDSLFDRPEVIDLWKDELAIHVAVRDNNSSRVAAFSFDYEWICTFRDITKEELPQIVWAGFESSKYANYTIDHLRILYDSKSLSYLFYLSDDKGDRYILYIREDGTPDCIISY
ncbi:MAG: PepSY-like domain-containing protein [Tannerellaceae bacterium]|jgi:hypothetical protein|nr:PepSY-like domain-containing protein [Tannerellaceae bacterium]